MTDTKVCKLCSLDKPLSAFSLKLAKGKQYPYSYCGPCSNIKNRERYALNRERNQKKMRDRSRERLYGITEADFKSLLEKQNNCCAICFTDSPRGMGTWHVDHNHVTGAVRGLLCHSCNVGIGSLKDSVTLLENAIAYLRKYDEPTR